MAGMQEDCRNNPCRRITLTLVRAGVLVEDPEQPWLDLESGSTLEHLAAAAVRYRIALDPMPKRKTLMLHEPGVISRARESAKPLTAARDGFSLNAAVACKDHERDKLEHLCRYVSRGPIALERLSIDGDGLVVYAFKHPFRDGTTHVCCTWMYECRGRQAGIVPDNPLHSHHPWRSDAGSGLFEPLDFIARLAALVPRPRAHLVRYHGLFAPIAHGSAGAAKHMDVRERPMRNIAASLSTANPRDQRRATASRTVNHCPPLP